ncbi:hypothetical protein TIFTF001_033962 [Ficus carica]|uniref:Uncharacterized protein n=1 Tax=Ficus carica TaxID=3494 RepID=A0AA88DZ13_FICCA|nr:hypothetical protein TIFTF001_033962 [Ficus carica]
MGRSRAPGQDHHNSLEDFQEPIKAGFIKADSKGIILDYVELNFPLTITMGFLREKVHVIAELVKGHASETSALISPLPRSFPFSAKKPMESIAMVSLKMLARKSGVKSKENNSVVAKGKSDGPSSDGEGEKRHFLGDVSNTL